MRTHTSFWNVFGLEIVGTIIFLIGIIIIHRIYPFPQTNIAIILSVFVLVINILDFFLYKYTVYIEIRKYLPFLISIILMDVSKLLEVGLRYFGNSELAKKWHSFYFIIFFGFSIPYYLYTSLRICNFLTFEHFSLSKKVILLFLPFVILVIIFALHYLFTILQTFKFLIKTKKKLR